MTFSSFSVLAKGLNDGGRGLNIVIVDPKTKEVVRVGHFDTYAEGMIYLFSSSIFWMQERKIE